MDALTVAEPANADAIRSRILTIRGVQVMLDRDLAELYGVPTKRLNEQVKRNIERFPERFMFQLTVEDAADLRSQFATSNKEAETGIDVLRSQFATSKRGGTRYLPYAFTEHGIIMLASVLNSPTAIAASVQITDTFVAMRRALASLAPLLSRIEATERRQLKQEDAQARNEERFNAQYADSLTVKVSDSFHDRFLIIDGSTLIHVGASLNHLGKKCFAFSSLDKSNIPDILAKLNS